MKDGIIFRVDSDQGVIELLRSEGVELDQSDVDNMGRLTSLGESLGMSAENIHGAFESVVRNPDFQNNYTPEEGAVRLLEQYCGNDQKLAESTMERAQEAISQLDGDAQAYLDETGLGSNPAVIIAFSNMIESKFGSAVDEPGFGDIPGPSEDM